ncbi:MogA/MoaB family molybdenum cofactor biosynthesis protein [Marispirochaeta aestuarii]|uniref:MogA/MoaB family molybdenum cofactor biosynthesis protein n=1 Tax=Marispirochaeta aestuarii TaxID=1963862 RepID=UPI0029C77FF3|nr:MogA/MoaB family molybdenum cofactor biosynthesis protein [Marispirochaeta aestuarii]
MKLSVITISDRASRGEYQDLSGPAIMELLRDSFPEADIRNVIVPDDADALLSAFTAHANADYILTTGGTGISPRDITPETTEKWCEKALPGIAELLRAKSYEETPNALFSRGYAGIRGKTIVVNFPGSVKAVRFCTALLVPVMEHGVRMLRGEGHG